MKRAGTRNVFFFTWPDTKRFFNICMFFEIIFRQQKVNFMVIKGSLSSSWMNSPIPSLLLPLRQNESASCETIGRYQNICHLYSHQHENQVIFMIFMGNVLHKHSLCKWKLRRWKSKSAYTLLFYKNVVFPAQAEYSYFSADFRLKTFLYYS